jgi:endonuclease YncB( thermonuclease family)
MIAIHLGSKAISNRSPLPLAAANQGQAAIVQVQPDQQQSETWQLVPGSIYDGDTLRVQREGAEIKIRMCGIDAPEHDQPMGIDARDHLRSLVSKGDGSLIVVQVEKDRYGRSVAELFVKPRAGQGYQPGEEISLNAQMVADGFAYHYAQYSRNCPNGSLLARIEADAKAAKLGVWKNPSAQKPWDYRH